MRKFFGDGLGELFARPRDEIRRHQGLLAVIPDLLLFADGIRMEFPARITQSATPAHDNNSANSMSGWEGKGKDEWYFYREINRFLGHYCPHFEKLLFLRLIIINETFIFEEQRWDIY